MKELLAAVDALAPRGGSAVFEQRKGSLARGLEDARVRWGEEACGGDEGRLLRPRSGTGRFRRLEVTKAMASAFRPGENRPISGARVIAWPVPAGRGGVMREDRVRTEGGFDGDAPRAVVVLA